MINTVPYTGGQQYFYLKIIQKNDDDEEDRIWTAPVWFEPTAPTVGPTTPPTVPAVLTLTVDRVAEVATITNTGGQAVSLAGWTLRSVRGDQKFSFPMGTASNLPAGGTILVKSGPTAVGTVPGTLNWTTSFIWNNDNDPAELIDTNMVVVAQEP